MTTTPDRETFPRCNPRELSVLAYANGFTLWHYAMKYDERISIRTDGYFNPVADMLVQGDLIIASVQPQSGPGGSYFLQVYQNQEGQVVTL